jgi:uncharacterized surface protein with fasciclin (FAS1) repeats
LRSQFILALIAVVAMLGACSADTGKQEANGQTSSNTAGGGQGSVQDSDSQKDIVKIAVGSKDHSTLVKAVQAAGLVDVLSNAGPFTVFAPTNAAFDELKPGTLEELTKPENKEQLSNVLYHHVQVSVYSMERLRGMSQILLFDGKPEQVEVRGEDVFVGGAKILGSVRASNGIVYVVDRVILAD